MRLLILFLFLSLNSFAQNFETPSIIPKPLSIVMSQGAFDFSKIQAVLTLSPGFEFEAAYLEYYLKKDFNIEYSYVGDKILSIWIGISRDTITDNDYNLRVDSFGISITANTSEGAFHGVQTLLQLLHGYGQKLPYMQIMDSPKFVWRGMHLDCSRHFFSVPEVKKYLDYMAMYKMNVFHWHLTDDQGWRLEIKKYPKLTELGAWRKGSMQGPYQDNNIDTFRYGGFYSQEDVKEIVKYASQRHIQIVPEIEMPGHSLAALAAYPFLACKDSVFEVGKKWGVFEDVLCAGNDSVFRFYEDVLDEVMALFPSKYIHIGGDECPKTAWKNCPKCQKRIADENLKDEHELQSYFIQRIEKYINAHGRRIIGWDEILEGGLAPNAAVMSWRGTAGGIAAAKAKHLVVMSPGKPCYFDHYQVKEKETEPLAIGGLNTLKDVYDFNPIPKELSAQESIYILGAQGNVWTEYMTDFKQIEYMILPRMAALSEVLWTRNEEKNYSEFVQRMKQNAKILDQRKIHYCGHFMEE